MILPRNTLLPEISKRLNGENSTMVGETSNSVDYFGYCSYFDWRCIQIVPTGMILIFPTIAAVKPYTPLELGEEIYTSVKVIVGCHVVRPFREQRK
jgi:hypothetical protein